MDRVNNFGLMQDRQNGIIIGLVVGVVGVLVILFSHLHDSTKSAALESRSGVLQEPHAGISPSAAESGVRGTGQLHRECPHCKEGMRCDAGVCPHCRRESTAWQFWEGRWWTARPDGTQLWLDEGQQTWRTVAELPKPEASSFDVVVAEISKNPRAVARIVSRESGVSREAILAELEHLPATVLHGVDSLTAESARNDLVASGTAQAKIVPLSPGLPSPPGPLWHI